jgi:hypothetical protein
MYRKEKGEGGLGQLIESSFHLPKKSMRPIEGAAERLMLWKKRGRRPVT